ncbi:LruC domain-containing protein [uncultured Bacteroides sp.]|uniref:LruC domain-containing protein n=1 Tax=uncultured Bacteroides sp. TaxID=162156 RepID=UPI002AABD3C3|nr:LruC domain-containing protein [uncultured Bacteroides sp.]
MKTTFKKIMALFIITSSLFITGCQKDLYDPNYVATKNGLLTGIPADFNWSTLSSVNLTVNVNDQYNGEFYYIVEVFDSNPVIDSKAKLLTKGVAKKGQSFSSVVSISQTTKSIAIRQTSPTGLTVTRMVDVASIVTVDFGTTATKSISTRSSSGSVLTRSASDTDKNDFVSTMPTNIASYDQSQQGTITKFKLEDGTYDDINVWTPGVYLYATGKIHITKLYLASKCKLYILPGAEVTLDAGNNLGQPDEVISIAENATLKVGTLTPSSNVKILNKGTISASEIQLAGTSLLYNAGTVSVSGDLSGQNDGSTIENDGTVTALNLLVQGNSSLSNYNEINVSNLTTVDCTGGSWTNEGHYTTKSMAVSAHNSNVFNKCKLVVTDNLKFNTGNIKIDGGAYVSCSTLDMDNCKIDMGANSIMKVSTQANYNYNPLSGGYGFYGPTSGKALLKLKKAVANSDGQNYVINYSGNIQIECENHPDINVDPSNIRFTEDPTIEWVKEGETTITISSSNCSEGNTASQGGTPSNPTFPIAVEPDKDYTFAMEDSWPNYGDYDMNDLVATIRTSYQKNSSNKATQMTINVTLRAVGALKTIGAALQMDNVLADNIQQVTNNGTNLDGSIFERNSAGIESEQSKAVIPLFDNAHKFLKSSGMTNTIVGKNNVPAQTAKITISFKNPISVEDTDIKSLNFFIVTDGKKDSRTEIHLAGYAPTDKFNKSLLGTGDDNSVSGISFTSKNEHLVWGMIIPAIFNYPVEYEKITDAYPNFGAWAQSIGKNNQDWYNSPKSGATY